MKALTPEQRAELAAQIKSMHEALDKIYKNNEKILALINSGQRKPGYYY